MVFCSRMNGRMNSPSLDSNRCLLPVCLQESLAILLGCLEFVLTYLDSKVLGVTAFLCLSWVSLCSG